MDLNLLPFLDSCHNYYKEYFIIYKRQHTVSLSLTLALLCKYGISNTCSWCFCNFNLSLSLFSLRFFLVESLSLSLYLYIYIITTFTFWGFGNGWYMMMMLQVYSCNFWLYASYMDREIYIAKLRFRREREKSRNGGIENKNVYTYINDCALFVNFYTIRIKQFKSGGGFQLFVVFFSSFLLSLSFSNGIGSLIIIRI